jgi:hypothetical protein
MWFFNKKDPIDKGYLSKEKMKWVQKNVVFVMPMRQMSLIFLSCSFAKNYAAH